MSLVHIANPGRSRIGRTASASLPPTIAFLRFSIATALAGTLLHIGGFESGCFHLYGKSSEGKTTCLRMAGSVWGSGADGGYVRTWRSTANGLEATFAGAYDTCLPLDEVGQVEGRELGQALYMATGGVGKQRMRRDATLRPSHIWRTMVLSSGEHPIEAKLNEDPRRGARAHAGQLVRAVDIPVRGTHGVFDAFESECSTRRPTPTNARPRRRRATGLRDRSSSVG